MPDVFTDNVYIWLCFSSVSCVSTVPASSLHLNSHGFMWINFIFCNRDDQPNNPFSLEHYLRHWKMLAQGYAVWWKIILINGLIHTRKYLGTFHPGDELVKIHSSEIIVGICLYWFRIG